MPVKTPLYGDKQTWLDRNRNLLITKIQNTRGNVRRSDKNPTSFQGRSWKRGQTSEVLLGASLSLKPGKHPNI